MGVLMGTTFILGLLMSKFHNYLALNIPLLQEENYASDEIPNTFHQHYRHYPDQCSEDLVDKTMAKTINSNNDGGTKSAPSNSDSGEDWVPGLNLDRQETKQSISDLLGTSRIASFPQKKRQFNSWGGKRLDPVYLNTKMKSVGNKRQFNSWGGKRSAIRDYTNKDWAYILSKN